MNFSKIYFFVFLFIIVLLGNSCSNKEKHATQSVPIKLDQYIEQFCINNDSKAKENLKKSNYILINQVIDFYKKRNFKSVWIQNQSVTPIFNQAFDILKHSMSYGLDTLMYATHIISYASNHLTPKESITTQNQNKVAVEMLTTHSFLLFLSHLQAGIFRPDSAIYDNMIIPKIDSIPQFLEKSIHTNDISIALNAVSPKNPQYRDIQKALSDYLATAKISTLKFPIPYFAKDSTGCKKGVEEMLRIHGFLSEEIEKPSDKTTLITALVKFQTNFGLRNRGQFDTLTLETLRNSTFDLYRKACITLQRIRWSNIDAPNYLLVNIPSFMVQLVEEGEIAVTHKIVCGKPDHETPELNSRISHFQLFPEWNVPHKISTKELLPNIQANPKYLEKHNYEIINGKNEVVDASKINFKRFNEKNFPYRIRQSSGEGNSLGIIKFYFNNKYGVYLHDTPSKSLFNLNYRAFSHGCMRVQNPFDFATTLLEFKKGMLHHPVEKQKKMGKYQGQIKFEKYRKKKEEMTEVKKMNQDVIDIKQTIFNMNKPLPIYVRYFTCFINDKNKLQFYPDLYHKDSVLINQYNKALKTFIIFN